MAKRQSNAYLSSGELVGGTIFFVVYLLVLPFATEPLFRLISILLDVNIGKGLQNTIYYYVIFALTVIIFHGLLARTSRNLMDNLGTAAKTLGAGLIALYGLNELVYRLTHMLIGTQTNLNDMTINAQIDTAPRSTLVIVILLAPFVEEVLFRGLVFGGLRSHSRTVAYLVSCLLFAFLHVWQYAWGSHDVAYFWLMVQYLVPGMVLAWAYDHSGTLWTSVGLHAAANALSVLALHF
ncbi:MAG: type II CAAX endopeptidase family protein [Oscillibacter ruminantium]|jgi:membrane protease YdiL (CAAX protease family)|uniref:CPBP family intramembrane glutamic endopeptidase n=1 Tax=Oscillibacter ruminantium TaxID=1263547 RepID=UPI002B1F2A4C|nr:type II CAAX endopeptidase family protein [Oscillibacter ruminantium]MEA5041742.1 type II CAAX endopeptidase family protein [Oscillibacter ruminantium]